MRAVLGVHVGVLAVELGRHDAVARQRLAVDVASGEGGGRRLGAAADAHGREQVDEVRVARLPDDGLELDRLHRRVGPRLALEGEAQAVVAWLG